VLDKQKILPGLLTAGLILTLIIGAIAGLLWQSSDFEFHELWQDSYYWHITGFSFYQSFISTLLSVGLAIPVAHALSRREFFGKGLLLKLFAITLVLPVLVGIFGLLAIYGNSGLLADLFEQFNAKLPFSIYGLNGILLAHVFFNLPFAARLLLQSLQSIPIEQHKLAAHLGMGHWSKFKIVEWPYLKEQLPNIVGLVFMLCFTSFATVMALGGGPKSTTVELAIYQAIKFDFDLQTGALLALWQMFLCGSLVIFIQRFSRSLALDTPSHYHVFNIFNDSQKAKCWDALWIVSTMLFVIPPLLMVIANSASPIARISPILTFKSDIKRSEIHNSF